MCHFDFDSFLKTTRYQISIKQPKGSHATLHRLFQVGCNEDADLPWTGAEELLVKSTNVKINEKSKESSKEETVKIEETMKESPEIEAWGGSEANQDEIFVVDFCWC